MEDRGELVEAGTFATVPYSVLELGNLSPLLPVADVERPWPTNIALDAFVAAVDASWVVMVVSWVAIGVTRVGSVG